jgi:hypothetical protein
VRFCVKGRGEGLELDSIFEMLGDHVLRRDRNREGWRKRGYLQAAFIVEVYFIKCVY